MNSESNFSNHLRWTEGKNEDVNEMPKLRQTRFETLHGATGRQHGSVGPPSHCLERLLIYNNNIAL